MSPPSAMADCTRARRVRRAGWMGIACGLGALSAFGCGSSDKPSAAPPPTEQGRGPREPPSGGGYGGTDAGTPEDGGSTMWDGGMDSGMHPAPSECFELSSSPILMPTDFEPTHVAATWLDDCSPPTVWLSLSEDGCPDGLGHELSFYIEASAIDDGRIFPGENPLAASVLGGMSVFYQRPGELMPWGEWGNCFESNGVYNLERFVPEATGEVSLSFELSLTDCTASDGITPPFPISGRLDVNLARGLMSACP